MDRFAKLVSGAALVLAAFSAHAGYAQLSPPAGWSPSTSGATFAFGPATNAATLANGTVRTNASLNVGGRVINVPAALRFSANAPRIAAAVIFNHPIIRTAVGVASLLSLAKISYDESSGLWNDSSVQDDYPQSTGYLYSVGGSAWLPSMQAACSSAASIYQSVNSDRYMNVEGLVEGNSCTITYTVIETRIRSYISWFISSKPDGTCPVGWYITPAGCSSTLPARTLTEEEFVDKLSPFPIPVTVPKELPSGTPLPVDNPVLNPAPGENPTSRPLFFPTGNPVPNPSYDPNSPVSPNNQPFTQPGVNVNPAPTVNEPWRVDVQPVNRPQSSPDPLSQDELDEQSSENDKPKQDDSQSLCEKHPEILACQNLDNPSDQDLSSLEKPISIIPDSGWGAENSACPAPKMLQVQGRQIAIPYDLFCTYMQGMRPIIIAMAWLSAAFILIGARESS